MGRSAALLVFLALVAAPAVFGDHHGASEASVQKQHDVNYLLWKIDGELRDPHLKDLAINYDPLSHKEHYTDGGRSIDILLRELNDGHLLQKRHWFSLFNTRQRKEAVMLYDVLEHIDDWENFVGNAAFFRERMNEGQFVYALYAAVIHSPLTEHVVLPPLYEVTPHLFTNSEVIHKAYVAKMRQTPGKFESHFTGTKKNPEQRVAYFGEDIGMNTHHVMWHLEFPFWWDDKHERHHIDRKGENFFWVHHQLTMRFDAERLSNHLDPVDELHWDDEIVEGFAPHTMYKYGGYFPSRPDHVHFEDVDGVARVRDMLVYERRIRDAIDHGYITARDGSTIDINNSQGIDILGDVIESSTYSPNVRYYGSLHNTAHVMLGRQSDPHGKYALLPSVMEHFETATRDPAFFRLHKYMDNIFREHKDNLPPYTVQDLEFPGIIINDAKIEGNLETYFENFEYSLLSGMDDTVLTDDVEVVAVTKRLNHKEFTYKINVANNNRKEKEAVVRIFAWPSKDNNEIPFSFDDGRWNAIELDKFWVKLSPGSNIINRSCKDSSLAVPDVPSFQDLIDRANAGGDMHLEEYESATGIPNRFLLPKGQKQGMPYDIVLFLSDGEEDAAVSGLHENTRFNHYGYDGIYPDKRPHGYPLDRCVPDQHVFESLPNFYHTQVKIFHTE